jgi:hypothetical protein
LDLEGLGIWNTEKEETCRMFHHQTKIRLCVGLKNKGFKTVVALEARTTYKYQDIKRKIPNSSTNGVSEEISLPTVWKLKS